MGPHGERVIVFGWLKKMTQSDVSAPTQHPDRTLARDLNGRVIRPDIPHLTIPESASDAQKEIAIRWALEWTGSIGLSVSINEMIALLDQALIGRMPKTKDPSRRAISSAVRCLRLACEDNRAVQARRLLPWLQFRLGPQDHPCPLAQDLDHQLVACDGALRIPLPGCTADECKCWRRQITQAEANKLGES